MTIIRVIAVFVLAAPLVGCSTLQFWKSDKEPPSEEKDASTEDPKTAESADNESTGFFGSSEAKKSATKPATKSVAVDEHELKLAKLWARVDELEEEQLRQKERVRVLEKGLTLGLVPEELKTKKVAAVPPPPVALVVKAPSAPKAVEAEGKDEPLAASPALSKDDQDRYQAALASAHDHFRAGRYGRAIVEYSDIGKNFGDKVDGGMSQYWVARCWINLKEYNTARQHLVEFLKEHPSSPWMPRAKLELGRVEWKLGLAETALQRFRDVIQQHPYEDAAEMAKMELQNLDKQL